MIENIIEKNDNDLYFEIADISTENEYIRYPIYMYAREKYKDDEEMIPLSSYYYEALSLCIDKFDECGKKTIIRFEEQVLKMWLCCNDDIFKEFYDRIMNVSNVLRKMVRKAKEYNFKLNLQEIGYLVENLEIIVRNYYDKWAKNNKKIEDNMSSGYGCVAIAFPYMHDLRNSSNSYYSLSGSSKDYSGAKIPGWKLCLNREYLAVGNLLNYMFGYLFIECHLEDTTKRYTYYNVSKHFDRSLCNGNVLSYPINLYVDYVRRGSKPNFKAHYSCCEKKIISKMNFINLDYSLLKTGNTVINKLTSYVFKILKEPCRMCRPALIGCYNIYYDYNYYLKFITGFSKPHKISLGTALKEPLINA